MLNDCVIVVTLNKPPYIPIPFSNTLICILLYAMKEANKKVFITILENNIDLSRLIVRALETNKNINNNVNNVFYYRLNTDLNYFLLLLKCKSIRLFSSKLTTGTIIKKCEKYNTVLIWPNSMNGVSTCLAPSCISIRKLATNT